MNRNIGMDMKCRRCTSSSQEVLKRRRCTSSSQEVVKRRRCTASSEKVVKCKRCTSSSQEVVKRRRCTTSSQEALKRRKCTSSSRRCTASSQEVILDDEDLLALILLRLPDRKIMSFKSVSRKWLSLITDSYFTQLLLKLLPSLRASGLFIQRPPKLERIPDKVYFVPLDDKNTPSPFKTITFAHDPYDAEKIRILQSCKGLLLCSTAIFNPCGERNGYVYNPSINQLATLSKHPVRIKYGLRLIGLTFDPSKSIHYKVIGFFTTSQSEYTGDFYIYSSETGTWRSSIRSYSPAPGMHFIGGVCWNGCMHWLSDFFPGSDSPESSISDCLYFNMDEEKLETFPRPPISESLNSRRSLYFGESEDHLHVVEVCPYATSLSVYEMRSDYSEWFVKYQVDLDPISKVFPEMTEHKHIFRDKSDYAVAVLSLIRRENFQEDSFLVLEIPGKAIRYNLLDRSFKVIWDFSVDFSLTEIRRWRFGRLQAWQYVESLPRGYAR